MAEASFSTENVSISSGSTLLKDRSIPSTRTNGSLPPPNVLIPRIQNCASSFPGSPLRCTEMIPATFPARILLIERGAATFKVGMSTDEIAATTDSFF